MKCFNIHRYLYTSVIFYIFHTKPFLIIHLWCKVHVNDVNVKVVTPPELKMVCGKSNEINGGKNCFVFDRKMFAFDQL